MTALDNAKRAAVLADDSNARVVDVVAAMEVECPKCFGEGTLLHREPWLRTYYQCHFCGTEGVVPVGTCAECLADDKPLGQRGACMKCEDCSQDAREP